MSHFHVDCLFTYFAYLESQVFLLPQHLHVIYSQKASLINFSSDKIYPEMLFLCTLTAPQEHGDRQLTDSAAGQEHAHKPGSEFFEEAS